DSWHVASVLRSDPLGALCASINCRVFTTLHVRGLYGVRNEICTPLFRMQRSNRPQLQTMEGGESHLAWLQSLLASLHLLPGISIFDACWRGLLVCLEGVDKAHVPHVAACLDRAIATVAEEKVFFVTHKNSGQISALQIGGLDAVGLFLALGAFGGMH
ncbi:unnamed protein product, partial [Symbiodinium necroappetens]